MSNEFIQAVNAAATAADVRQSAARLQVSAAIENASEFGGGVIPDAASSWSHPGEDWGRSCYHELSNAEAATHNCPDAAAPVGDRARALVIAATGGREDDAAEMALAASQDAPSAFTGPGDAVAHYHRLLQAMGILHVHDTGARDDGDPTDHDQHRKGGKVRPGVAGGIHDSALGGAEEITARHPEMFKGRLADRSKFGQRDDTLARG